MEWTAKEVSIPEIVVMMDLQMRVNEPAPEEYEELLRKNRGEWPFPPLRCVQVGDQLLLVEGFTRLRAATNASRRKVPIEVRDGTYKDAVMEACASNYDHGYRRTTADKRRAVLRAKEEVDSSPTKIATICRVSRAFVYSTLEELKPEPATKKSRPKTADEVAPAPARAPKSESEIDDKCPVCGNRDWVATDAGYTCEVCQHEHGEVAAAEEEESEDRASRRELIEEGVAKDLATVNTDYGRLQRSMKRAGLYEKSEHQMLHIFKKIQEAIRAQRRS
jgi:hypothetical protein